MKLFGDGPRLGLVGDIGGTNCRFALAVRGSTALASAARYPVADFLDLNGAIAAYLEREAPRRKLDWAVIAVAGAVDNGTVALTNHSWKITAADIAAKFGIREVRLVNDFSALARATPLLDPAHLTPVGAVSRRAFDASASTTAVIGPGTGLGVGGLALGSTSVAVLTTEGGHTTFAPNDDLEREIVRLLLTRFERVSNERLLCGEGLCNIYWALSQIDGVEPEILTAKDITQRASEKSDPRCVRTLDVFTRALGAFGGDVVLMMGARGGLFLAGGMLPAILDVFDHAAFRAAFEAKGRFRSYLEQTPAHIIVHPFAALMGAAALADESVQADQRGGDIGVVAS